MGSGNIYIPRSFTNFNYHRDPIITAHSIVCIVVSNLAVLWSLASHDFHHVYYNCAKLTVPVQKNKKICHILTRAACIGAASHTTARGLLRRNFKDGKQPILPGQSSLPLLLHAAAAK